MTRTSFQSLSQTNSQDHETCKCTRQAYELLAGSIRQGCYCVEMPPSPPLPRPRPLFGSMAAFVHDISRETHGLKKGTSSLNQLLHIVARSERVVGYTTKCQLAQVTFSSNTRCAYGMLFHHCLATVSVAVHTGQLRIMSSLRIEGRPTPWAITSSSRGHVPHVSCEIFSRNDVAVELLY